MYNKIKKASIIKTDKMRPLYELTIDDTKETGMDFNSFVDVPAHLKGFIAFGTKQKPLSYTFDSEATGEKRIVTGVMISADTKIIREDDVHGVHDVFFSAETIEQIQKKFMLQGGANNVNKMHDMDQVVQGAKMLYNYIIGGAKNPKAPDAFKQLNLQDGTWIASYYIEDDKLWDEVKKGEFQGFSIEGYFNREKIETKKEKMKKKTIFDYLGFKKEEEGKTKFESIETVDGTVLNYDGALNVDSIVTMEGENGEQVPAAAGDYQVTIDEVAMVLTVTVNDDGEAIVSAIEEVTEEDMKADIAAEEMRKEVAEVVDKVVEDSDERFKAIEAKFEASEAQNAKLEEFISKLTDVDGNKFNAQAKKKGTATTGTSRRDLLNRKK